jgi:hypothetical protein
VIEDRFVCPHCRRPVERRPYLMSVDPDRPGLLGILRGEAGEALKLLLVIALCILGTLFLAALLQIVAH